MSDGGDGFDNAPDSGSDVSESLLLRPGMDRILDILRKRNRRLILLLLKEGTVETHTDLMIRGENKTKEVGIALRHTHLPKLEDTGYIEWDRETGEISKGPRFEEIVPLLELIETHADELPPGWP
ncbi:DUF7344 domain-containing protein [Natronomonas sp.]|uniref:DUF7344 domain-containing protein n=1 Tax=Natronomonas sp. TaxID=2184060 RepID=UPI002FC3A32E